MRLKKLKKFANLFNQEGSDCMDTQKITADYRLSQWAQIIQARLDSGQNVKNFCQAAGVKRSSYFYWQKKLRDAACTELAKVEENNKEIVPSGWTQLNPK
jgi:putative transposase